MNEERTVGEEIGPDQTTDRGDGARGGAGDGAGDGARGVAGDGVGTTREDAGAEATAQLAAARAQIAELSGKLRAESVARRLREAIEDAGAVRVRDAMRVAAVAAARLTDATTEALARVVEEVRAAHPEFFGQVRWPSTNASGDRHSSAAGSNADGSNPDGSNPSGLDALATRARASNDRRALLEYLRARRER